MTGCILDASLSLTLGAARALPIALDNPRYEWLITPLGRGELVTQETREVVDRAIVDGRIRLVELDTTSVEEMLLWSEWSRRLDAGEAEGVAVALARGYILALEDRQAQRALDRATGGGRWINSANLLIDAVSDRRLSLEEGDEIFRALDCYAGYAGRGILSLGDLE